VATQSIKGVVEALNTLNQGIFSYSGSTIYVSSSYYIYSNISIAGTSIFGTTTANPYGLTIDSSGNVYTATNLPSVSKITPSGVSSVLATFLATQNPIAITIDSLGNLYTANINVDKVFKISPSGTVTTFGTSATNPTAITIDSLGNIYTCGLGSTQIFKITALGVQTSYGNIGTNSPTGLVCDSSGNIFVCCSGNDTIYKVTSAGVTTAFSTFPLSSLPVAITIDSSDNLYVAVQSLEYVSKITPLGVQTTYGVTGAGTLPLAIAIVNLTNIYTANSDLTITKILATGGSIIPLATIPSGFLSGIIVDNFYNVYVSNIVDNNVYLIVQ
jgi:sugar lactone lactonase YvrE